MFIYSSQVEAHVFNDEAPQKVPRFHREGRGGTLRGPMQGTPERLHAGQEHPGAQGEDGGVISLIMEDIEEEHSKNPKTIIEVVV